MTHPITPPPELVQHWIDANRTWPRGIALEAAQWGADQELEACCEWLEQQTLCGHRDLIPSLRAARRPKPPSLKEQSLALIDGCNDPDNDYLDDNALATIRRALESIND
jgi:hypothetical protein